MILLRPKKWICDDCGRGFEKPPSLINPLNGMDTWNPKCQKCGSKNVLPKYVSVIRNAVKSFFG